MATVALFVRRGQSDTISMSHCILVKLYRTYLELHGLRQLMLREEG